MANTVEDSQTQEDGDDDVETMTRLGHSVPTWQERGEEAVSGCQPDGGHEPSS